MIFIKNYLINYRYFGTMFLELKISKRKGDYKMNVQNNVMEMVSTIVTAVLALENTVDVAIRLHKSINDTRSIIDRLEAASAAYMECLNSFKAHSIAANNPVCRDIFSAWENAQENLRDEIFALNSSMDALNNWRKYTIRKVALSVDITDKDIQNLLVKFAMERLTKQ